jgi:hypothetical protein
VLAALRRQGERAERSHGGLEVVGVSVVEGRSLEGMGSVAYAPPEHFPANVYALN